MGFPRKFPIRGFEDVDQMNIFYNGLRLDTSIFLDIVVGGTMSYHQLIEKRSIVGSQSRGKEFWNSTLQMQF